MDTITVIFQYSDGTSKTISRAAGELEFEKTISPDIHYARVINANIMKEILLDKLLTSEPYIVGVIVQYNNVAVITIKKGEIADMKYACNYTGGQGKLWEYIEFTLKG